MPETFWIFVSIAVFMGTLLPIVAISIKHKEKMKELEIEALKIKNAKFQSEYENSAK